MSGRMVEALLGAWKLDRWLIVDRAGERPSEYFGGLHSGYCLYAPEGFHALHLERPGRQLFRSGDPHQATNAELAASGRDFLSLMSRFSVEAPNRVIHTIFACSCPNWIGMQQTRYADVSPGSLILRTFPTPVCGTLVFAELQFSRLPGAVPRRKASL